jgi:hypothetical protein
MIPLLKQTQETLQEFQVRKKRELQAHEEFQLRELQAHEEFQLRKKRELQAQDTYEEFQRRVKREFPFEKQPQETYEEFYLRKEDEFVFGVLSCDDNMNIEEVKEPPRKSQQQGAAIPINTDRHGLNALSRTASAVSEQTLEASQEPCKARKRTKLR